jgi:hypothetical protein
MKNIILFADLFDQLTIVHDSEVKAHLPYYMAMTQKELAAALDNLKPDNPWFYIETTTELADTLR